MQMCTATAATGISHRLKGAAGEETAVAVLRTSSDGILASVSRDPRLGGRYSWRRASIGVTAVARRAGRALAPRATADTRNDAAQMVAKSMGRTPNSWLSISFPRPIPMAARRPRRRRP